MSVTLESVTGGYSPRTRGGIPPMYIAVAVVLVVVLFVASRGNGGIQPGHSFDAKRGEYNAKIYALSADKDVKIQTAQLELDKAAVQAAVSLAGIEADAAGKRDAAYIARDVGLAQIAAGERLGMRKIDADENVGVRKIAAEREKNTYDYQVNLQRNETQRKADALTHESEMRGHQVQENNAVFNFFGNLIGGVLGLIGIRIGG